MFKHPRFRPGSAVMRRYLVAFAAAAALLTGGTGVAFASSSQDSPAQDPCVAATEAVADAQADLDAAVADALERARELGITNDKIDELLDLVDGGLDQAEIDRAVELFRESGAADNFDLIADGQLVLRIADLGRVLFEAENERGAACPSPIAPTTTMPMPTPPPAGAVGDDDNDEDYPQVPVVPDEAPDTGGGPA